MDSDQQLKVHVSIQKGFSFPPLQKCQTCCTPGKFHCPFCLPASFKPSKMSCTRRHLDNHLRRAIYVGDYTMHRCKLECRHQPHYHCLYCTATVIRKRDFIAHLPLCREAHQRRAQQLSQLQTAATPRVQTEGLVAPSLTSGDILSFDIECDSDSDSDSDGNDITIISDSDDENSRGASSSQSVTPIMPKSNKCYTVDRPTQTNIEKPQDCDEYYFMGLVKLFKKLSPQKKADVRMKIERLLFEAEFN